MAKKEYEGEFKITIPRNRFEFNRIETPTFEPFSGENREFRFEATYREIRAVEVYDDNFILFQLSLVQLFKATITATLPKLEVSVHVNYLDGSIFTSYSRLVLYSRMKLVHFSDVIQRKDSFTLSEHLNKILVKTLIIKCKMTIYHQDQTSHTTGKEMKQSKFVDVMKNLKSIYEQSVLSDFVFKVGEKSFHAHRIILSAHSPVFMKMMTQDFVESKTNSVTITDAEPEIFELFLRSLYGGELENASWDSLKELYYLVDKYDVGFLKIQCTDAAISILSVDIVCEVLKLAYSFSNSDLKTAAVNFAVNHIKEIFPREDWNELVKTHPMIGFDVTVNFVPK